MGISTGTARHPSVGKAFSKQRRVQEEKYAQRSGKDSRRFSSVSLPLCLFHTLQTLRTTMQLVQDVLPVMSSLCADAAPPNPILCCSTRRCFNPPSAAPSRKLYSWTLSILIRLLLEQTLSVSSRLRSLPRRKLLVSVTSACGLSEFRPLVSPPECSCPLHSLRDCLFLTQRV